MGSVKERRFVMREAAELDRDRQAPAPLSPGMGGGGIMSASLPLLLCSLLVASSALTVSMCWVWVREWARARSEGGEKVVEVATVASGVVDSCTGEVLSAAEDRRRISCCETMLVRALCGKSLCNECNECNEWLLLPPLMLLLLPARWRTGRWRVPALLRFCVKGVDGARVALRRRSRAARAALATSAR